MIIIIRKNNTPNNIISNSNTLNNLIVLIADL